MDWESFAKWAAAPGGLAAGLATWLLRRRRTPQTDAGNSGSWIGRRLNAEKDLIACRESQRRQHRDFADERTRWTAQEASMTRQQDLLMAAMEQLVQANELVLSRRDSGRLATSSAAPDASPPSSSPGPTTPRAKRGRSSTE